MKTDDKNLHALLAAYLYNELDSEQRAEVERYLAENPDLNRELAALKALRGKLALITDKEVIAPQAIKPTSAGKAVTFGPARVLLAAAASVALILVSGWLTRTHISWSGHELRISFGQPPVTGNTQGITTETVEAMIEAALAKHQPAGTSPPPDLKQQVHEWVRTALPARSSQPNQAIDEYLKLYTANLYAENARIMREYLLMASKEQQQAIGELLVDMTRYLEQQRQNDLQNLYTRLNALEQNTELYQQQTDQLLTGIITSVSSTPTHEIKY